MTNDRQRSPKTIRDNSPCNGCTERFIACSDRCPKDERGEYGHKAYTNEIKRVKEEKQKYLNKRYVRRKKYSGGGIYGKK